MRVKRFEIVSATHHLSISLFLFPSVFRSLSHTRLAWKLRLLFVLHPMYDVCSTISRFPNSCQKIAQQNKLIINELLDSSSLLLKFLKRWIKYTRKYCLFSFDHKDRYNPLDLTPWKQDRRQCTSWWTSTDCSLVSIQTSNNLWPKQASVGNAIQLIIARDE